MQVIDEFITDISWGATPRPGCNRHHQDDITFVVRNPDLNLHLPLLLGGGTTQNISVILPNLVLRLGFTRDDR